MQCYPEYKESRIDSIGKIPEHWVSSKLGYVSTIFKGGTPKRNVDRYFQGDLPWARPVDITGLKGALYINDTKIHISEEALGNSGARRLPVGTVLLTSRATIGETAITTVPMATNQGFANFYCNPELFNVFLVYYLQAIKDLLISLGSGSTFLEVTKRTLLGVGIPVPPLPEQTQIANFLDHKTAQIDGLIRAKERKIELLGEYRASLITHTVTKGLDPNVQMKSSGLTWIGEIPNNWQIKSLKYITRGSLTNGLFKKKNQFGSGTKLINVSDIYQDDFYVKFDTLNRVETEPREVETYAAEAGDIFFVRSSLKLEGIAASVCIAEVPEPTVFECHLVRLHPSPTVVLPRYLINYLNSNNVRQRLITLANTVTMTTIAQPKLASIEVILPPLSEQRIMVDFLDSKTKQIDELRSNEEQTIKLLKEYRQSLISEAVTGKIDVRREV